MIGGDGAKHKMWRRRGGVARRWLNFSLIKEDNEVKRGGAEAKRADNVRPIGITFTS